MKANILILMTVGLLAACASDDSRYKDTHDLERPPEVVREKQTAEQLAASEPEAPRRRHGKGLKSDVYRVEDSGSELKIKRSFDEAWGLVGQAIQLVDLKVPDQDRSKGVYYVVYNGSGLLDGAISYFKDDKDQTTYQLRLEPSGDETGVVVTQANKDEQADDASKKGGNTDEDRSANLTELLYDALHDDVKDE